MEGLKKHVEYMQIMNAFSLYKELGEEAVKSSYPEYLEFILENKDKTREELTKLVYNKKIK